MDINLGKLNIVFREKPLLVGGMAMEYYGLRKSGNDIDFLAAEEDVVNLIRLYPDRVKNLWGDLGVCPFEFEIWRTINLYDYSFYCENAKEQSDYFIISPEKLMVMKALAVKKEKFLNDLKLISEFIIKNQWEKYETHRKRVEELLGNIGNISYIENTGSGKQ